MMRSPCWHALISASNMDVCGHHFCAVSHYVALVVGLRRRVGVWLRLRRGCRTHGARSASAEVLDDVASRWLMYVGRCALTHIAGDAISRWHPFDGGRRRSTLSTAAQVSRRGLQWTVAGDLRNDLA